MNFKQKIFCVLLTFFSCCQVGSSYRIFILPEPESFCPGVFSGDDCHTWSEYSRNPFVADHSMTLIFTPGHYNRVNPYLNIAHVKSFSMIGDNASISLTGLLLHNVEHVWIYNLTFQIRSYSITVQDVRSFTMENCTLLFSYSGSLRGLLLYRIAFAEVLNTVFQEASIDASSSAVIVSNSSFSRVGHFQVASIRGDSQATLKVFHTKFLDSSDSSYSVINTANSLEMASCQITLGVLSNNDVIYCQGNINVTDSHFVANFTTLSNVIEQGTVMRAQYDIYVINSTFSNWKGKRALIESYSDSHSQWPSDQYQIYVIDSIFTNCNRAVYSINNVTIVNSHFYKIITQSSLRSQGYVFDGAVVYSTKSVTVIGSTFVYTTALNGNGGVIYSERNVFVTDSIMRSTNANLGGAIYTAPSQTEFIRETGYPNIQLLRSTFIHNSANSGGVLYTPGRYNYHIKITDSTFVLNRATTDVSGGGGVGHIGNTSLSISNSTFNDNAATNGGVFNVNYIQVNITDSSFSGNSASDNGGVFYGGKYSMNFTIADTIFTNNDADNGGVFYVRRHNSNIDVVQSQFYGNTAYDQGSVFDIRGVTLVIDRGTLIGNNSYSAANIPEADPDDYVINACVSEVTVFGFSIEPDPVNPMYCLIYSLDNTSSYNSSAANTEITTMAITHSPTRDRELFSTTNEQSKLVMHSISITTEGKYSPIASTVTRTSTPTTAHVSPHAITSSEWLRNSKQTPMSVMPSSTVGKLKVHHTTVRGETGDKTITTVNGKLCATPYPVINTGTIDTTDTADTAGTTNSDHQPNTQTSTTSLKSDEVSTKPSVQTSDQHQVDQNHYTDVMTLHSKIQTLLQVTIVSVSLLSVMVILMCMIMMALLVITCKNQSDSQRGGYSKPPPLSDHYANRAVVLEEMNAEYSFTKT